MHICNSHKQAHNQKLQKSFHLSNADKIELKNFQRFNKNKKYATHKPTQTANDSCNADIKTLTGQRFTDNIDEGLLITRCCFYGGFHFKLIHLKSKKVSVAQTVKWFLFRHSSSTGNVMPNCKTMNKLLNIILIILILCGCNDNSEKDELDAITDITNDYLERNVLKEILEPHDILSDKPLAKPNIDTLNLKVYISDALIPIAQIKEDNEWMFNDNYFGTSDSAIFYGIVNSGQFKKLGYREFDKNKMILKKPFRQFEKSQEKIIADEVYSILNFSRVCFDSKRENGVVVIEYLQGFESGTMNGYHMALLIKKKNNKWTYIPRK